MLLRRLGFWAALLIAANVLAIVPAISAATAKIEFTVDAAKHDRTNTPVTVPIRMPATLKDVTIATLAGDSVSPLGQITAPGLLAPADSTKSDTFSRELHFVIKSLPAGKSLNLVATASDEPISLGQQAQFRWQDTPGEYSELLLGDRPVLRYMYKKIDESGKEARELTYKVYHHVYSPNGKEIITKGPGGQYTHHRGLFYGFNRVTYGDGKKADVWHCTGDAHLSHEGVVATEAGPLLGRHRVAVAWHGEKKEVFANEERELTVYNLPGGTLIEFASRVRPTEWPVRLDGDPQHAGFHFRAAQEVAEKTKSQTYYLRPDGQGKPGETRNWDPKSKQGPANLPWNAMSFVVNGQRYTAVYLDRPNNPKEARFSERDYGRFGSYFEYDLTKDHPLEVDYRVWVQEGETTGEHIAALAAGFVEPVQVKVLSDN